MSGRETVRPGVTVEPSPNQNGQRLYRSTVHYAELPAVLTIPRAPDGEAVSEAADGHYGQRSWAGGANWDATMGLLSAGWPEGRDKLVRGMALQTRNMTLANGVPARGYSVAGGAPSIGRYLSGNPRVSRTRAPDRTGGRPVLNVLVAIAVSSRVEAPEMMRRGIAIASAIDQLESEGFSLSVAAASGFYTEKNLVDSRVILKRAGEHLSADKLAFALGHPAMPRRVMFRIQESLPVWPMFAYGRPTHPVIDESDARSTVYIPCNNCEGCDTDERARATVAGHFNSAFDAIGRAGEFASENESERAR